MEDVHLSEEEKYRVTLQVDHFIDLLSKRYGIHPNEVIDAIQWVRDHRSIESKLHFGALISVIGVITGAALMALWEGVKHLLNNKAP
jgi:hypothetical protein